MLIYFVIFKYLYYFNFFIYYYLTIGFKNLYLFVLSLIDENINKNEYKFFPYLFFLLFFLIFVNITGIIPQSFTLTSHVSLTMTLSLITFLTATYFGLKYHGVNFFSLFLPSNTPLVITPFLIIIELISYIARLFSLGIRLFANMMSGHTLLHILAQFGGMLIFFGSVWFFGGLLLCFIIFVITFLESSIAFLQAYVFIILFCIYVGDGVNLH